MLENFRANALNKFDVWSQLTNLIIWVYPNTHLVRHMKSSTFESGLIDNSKLANQSARLQAIVVKDNNYWNKTKVKIILSN